MAVLRLEAQLARIGFLGGGRCRVKIMVILHRGEETVRKERDGDEDGGRG